IDACHTKIKRTMFVLQLELQLVLFLLSVTVTRVEGARPIAPFSQIIGKGGGRQQARKANGQAGGRTYQSRSHRDDGG
ncbi:unnamed protein product, partial [Amoebophrya sp. A25]